MLSVTNGVGRDSIAADYLIIVGPLAGVVIAGLALVISLLSDRYLEALRRDDPHGIVPFLRPFIFAAGIQLATLVVAVVYRAASAAWSERTENVAFVVLSFLFIFSLLEVLAVARNLIGHAVARSAEADMAAAEERVRDIKSRRG